MYLIWGPTNLYCLLSYLEPREALMYGSYLEHWLWWGLAKHQPLWVILYCLPEQGRKGIEEIVEAVKERDREGTGMKLKKLKKPEMCHYENTPIQIYRTFHLKKTENFQIKNSDIFHSFAQKHRLWVLVRTVSARQF